MIIDCISDLHGYLPSLDGGDLLIVAGDCTASDKLIQWGDFVSWLEAQDYRKKILVAGNHDGFLENCISDAEADNLGILNPNHKFTYLCDSGCEFESFKIWGSPWTPEFCNWHFMMPRGEHIKRKWDLIPNDTDILITHGPPYGILDEVPTERYSRPSKPNRLGHAGCEELLKAVDRVKPKLHVFGHIHSGGGKQILYKHLGPNTIMVNASLLDDDYEPTNKPTRIIL